MGQEFFLLMPLEGPSFICFFATGFLPLKDDTLLNADQGFCFSLGTFVGGVTGVSTNLIVIDIYLI